MLEEVSEALLDGFTIDGIKRLLSFELDKELSDYTNTTKGKREVAYELVTAAKREETELRDVWRSSISNIVESLRKTCVGGTSSDSQSQRADDEEMNAP